MAHPNGLTPVLDAPSEDASEATKHLRRSARLAVMAASGDAGLRAMESQSVHSAKRIEESTKRLEHATDATVKKLGQAMDVGTKSIDDTCERFHDSVSKRFTKLIGELTEHKDRTVMWLNTTNEDLRQLGVSWNAVRECTNAVRESIKQTSDGLRAAQTLLAAAFCAMAISCILLLTGAWGVSDAGAPTLKPWAPSLVIAGVIGSAFTVGLLVGARRVSAHIRF